MTVQQLWLLPRRTPAGAPHRGRAVPDARLGAGGCSRSLRRPHRRALLVAAAQEGLDQHKLEEALPRTDELPL